MNEKKSYKVQIFEEHYVLVSDDHESFVLKASEIVDATMKEISHQSGITDSKKIAVLSAIRIAHILLDYEQKIHETHRNIVALEEYTDQELSILST